MYIYTAKDIEQIDAKAAEQGFSIFALMENAGKNLAEALQPYVSRDELILILAGRGNNGGDGIVLARYLNDAGFRVTLHFPLGDPKTETAQKHLTFYQKQGYTASETIDTNEQPVVIVDALLGAGTKPPLRQNVADVVCWANKQPAHRYAVDLPSGVSADSGTVSNADSGSGSTPFQADVTFALHGAKPSAFLLPSSQYYGKVVPVPIGLQQTSRIQQTTANGVRATLAGRDNAAHKGTFGTSFLIAGSDDMPGSALLAAIGAVRSGTGKLAIGTTRLAASVITSRVPEATYMLEGLEAIGKGSALPPKVSAIGVGPGLQEEAAIEMALCRLLQTDVPLVVDAAAFTKRESWKRKATTVLTPHPGEFSRLTGMSIADIQADRITVAQDFARRHDVILVLKGPYTVIAFPDGAVNINPTGNSGLAKGGSGDVLTGMITSMLSYYSEPQIAVTNAVYLHGMCADVWAEVNSETTMTASDFHTLLPDVFWRMRR